MRSLAGVILGLAPLAALAAAQRPGPPRAPAPRPAGAVGSRVFAMGTEQSFAAVDTFDATFGQNLLGRFSGVVRSSWSTTASSRK